MSQELNVTCVQADLIWQDSQANIEQFNRLLQGVKNTDLIVLQEMFNTGFTMAPGTVAETMQGQTVQWMQNMAQKKQAVVMGSLIIEHDDQFFNRCVVALPNGELLHYDKRHLFSYASENEHYAAGHKRLIFEYKGFKICPLICYDLRFPVWARNTDNYDVLIYMANWPKPRIQAWDCLLKARAIENLCYCFGVNRIGEDANGLAYVGHTAGYDFFGNTILETKPKTALVKSVVLDKAALIAMREQFNFLADQDSFTL